MHMAFSFPLDPSWLIPPWRYSSHAGHQGSERLSSTKQTKCQLFNINGVEKGNLC